MSTIPSGDDVLDPDEPTYDLPTVAGFWSGADAAASGDAPAWVERQAVRHSMG